MVRLQAVTRLYANLKKLFFPAVFLIIFLSLSFAANAQSSALCPVAGYEGDIIKLTPEGYDPDPEIGPAGKLLWEFGPPFNAYGVWQTLKGQRGIFPFWISISDGEFTTTNHTCVELFPNNRNPVLDPVPEITVVRGESARIDATCYDPDGDMVEISFRFNGKDVAYIQYEPPGTYNIDVTCTDGFGGVDSERTKLHIMMPEVKEIPKPKPAPVTVAPTPAPAPEPKPQEVILAIPPQPVPSKPEVLEVRYPSSDCQPCPGVEPKPDNIDIIVYDSIYPVDTTKADSKRFVVESKPAPAMDAVPAPEPEPEPVIIGEDVAPCADDLDRKHEIAVVMGCCG